MSGRKLDEALEKGITNASNVLNVIGMVLLFVLMVQGAADVIGRYLGEYIFGVSKPIMGTMERSQVFLALMVVLGWGYTQMVRGHVTVEFFLRRFPPRVRARTNFATTFLVLVLFSLIVWQAVITAKLYHEAGRLIFTIHWPLAPFQLFVSLGALVLCLVLIMDMVRSFYQMKGGD